MKNLLFSLSAAALLLSACGKNDQPAPQTGAAATAAQAPEANKPAAPSGNYAKKDTYFKLPNAAGGEVDLAAYAGKPVLVMFFTETCPFCRKAAPFIQSVASAFGPKGLSTIGINVRDSAQSAKNFAADFSLNFPMAYNGGPVSTNYRTRGVPYIYLLTREHEIYDVWEGYDPQYDESITKAVETVLAKK